MKISSSQAYRFLFATLFVTSCGVPHGTSTSATKGHYEDADSASEAHYIGQQTMIPEHYQSDAVVVGLPLITEHGREDLIAAAIEAGAKKIMVMVPRNFRQTTDGQVFSRLRSQLGQNISKIVLVPNKSAGTVWGRDWAPQSAVTTDGKIRLLDFNYYPERTSDDNTPTALSESLGYERISMPVYNEGGNFMNNGRGDCLMTERVIEANSERVVRGDMILDNEQVAKYYKDFGGCKQVTVFPRMPYEGTGHLDMWAKFLDDDTIVVNQIDDAVIQNAGIGSKERQVAKSIQQFLEDRAQQIKGMGFKVVRISMPLPDARGDVYRSYTNGLVVNKTMIVPRYVNLAHEDDNTKRQYEQEVKTVYEQAGFKVVFIEADSLIEIGGAIHCVTMQIGNPSFNSLR